METELMGKVVVAATMENLADLYLADRGLLADAVRCVRVTDALADTGATLLSLPKRLIGQLGLKKVRDRRVRTSFGVVDSAVYEAVRLTVEGRQCAVEVAEVGDDCPVVIGQIPLEALDFVVDPLTRRLIGNPEHGGEHVVGIL